MSSTLEARIRQQSYAQTAELRDENEDQWNISTSISTRNLLKSPIIVYGACQNQTNRFDWILIRENTCPQGRFLAFALSSLLLFSPFNPKTNL